MCGVNGIYAYHYAANPVERAELERTRDHMMRRGPDGSGLWISDDARIGFGHRRLSVIDLSAAAQQPMASADGQLVVTFNGEIYNYRELRRALQARGRRFRSAGDTEVLLHLYAERGEAMVHDLRGMFAFALWDARRHVLLLARDSYGIKPLYYADDGWTLRFASQVKALLAGGAVPREADPAGLTGFYLLGSVPEPFTTYRAVRSVPAGATMLVTRLGPEPARRYHAIASAFCRAEQEAIGAPPSADTVEAAREAFQDSVRSHLVADVPVGAFLSSGIDSGALVGLMRDAGANDIQTVTIGFAEFAGTPQDETPLAAEVARRYETKHTTRIVTRAEFEADLPRLVEAMDQPSIDGVNTWFVAKAARELGLKVAISGLGGDELLGGYPSFRDIPRWMRTFGLPARVPLLGRAVRGAALQLAPALGLNPKAAGLVELAGSVAGAYLLKRGLFMPWELGDVLAPEQIRLGLRHMAPLRLIEAELQPMPCSPFAQVATLEAAMYMRNQLLRDTDWASMAHSLEVRVPLVDSVLLGRIAGPAMAAAAHPTTPAKSLLAAAPSRPLPEAITRRPKTGFTTPVERWMHAAGGPRSAMTPLQARGQSVPWARSWSRYVGGVTIPPAPPDRLQEFACP